MTDKRDNREVRLAEQLRENLKRRKEQARARKRAAEDAGGQMEQNNESLDGAGRPGDDTSQNRT